MKLDHHNSKQKWNGKNWVRVALCQNAYRNTEVNYGRGIGILQCYDNEQEYRIKIIYNEVETDVVYLCEKCKKELQKDARKHDYKLKINKIYK